GRGVFRWHGKVCGKAQLATNRPLCQRKTGDGLEKDLANLWSRKKITKKAHAGRGLETIWEIPDEMVSLNNPFKGNMKLNPLCLGTLCLAFFSLHASSATLYVDLNSTNPVSPYAGWNTAATNIQDAIDAANAGDAVLVTNGIYAQGGRVMLAITNRVALNKPISLQSVNGPWVTIIQGVGMTNGASAVRCAWLTNGASLTGFTLRLGATGSISDNTGGGAASFTNALVANCLIYSNTAAYEGGGAYQGTLKNCAIYGNNCPNGGGTCNSILNSCTVAGNSGTYTAGVYFSSCTNCIVYYNLGTPTGN